MSKEDLNLGWLASRQSGIPQKVKTIEGVSHTSVLDLKAQTERVKGIAQGVKDGTIEPGERRKRGIDLSLGPSNSGVRARDERDKQLQLKEVRLVEGPRGAMFHADAKSTTMCMRETEKGHKVLNFCTCM